MTVRDVECERRTKSGNILIESFGDFIGAKEARAFKRRQDNTLDDFVGLKILLAICDEEIFERHFARTVYPAKDKTRIASNQ